MGKWRSQTLTTCSSSTPRFDGSSGVPGLTQVVLCCLSWHEVSTFNKRLLCYPDFCSLRQLIPSKRMAHTLGCNKLRSQSCMTKLVHTGLAGMPLHTCTCLSSGRSVTAMPSCLLPSQGCVALRPSTAVLTRTCYISRMV